MKDTHLIIALYRALDRFGSSTRPEGEGVPERRPAEGAPHEDRRRSPGWVSIAEIEASQSPNTYPKLTRRAIRVRCEALAQREASPVLRIERSGDRYWVLVAPPGDAPEGKAAPPAEEEAPPEPT